MTDKKLPTSVFLDPALKARAVEVKKRSAVLEWQSLGRRIKGAGWGYEELLLWGIERAEAEIAARWTAEHEAMLESVPPPETLRASHGRDAAPDGGEGKLGRARSRS